MRRVWGPFAGGSGRAQGSGCAPTTLFNQSASRSYRDQLVHRWSQPVACRCFLDIAAALAPDDAAQRRATGDAHLAAGWTACGDDFVGAHWLATFAALALDAAC